MTDTQSFNEQFTVELPPRNQGPDEPEEAPKKKKKKKRRRKASPIWGILLLILLGFLTYEFMMSGFFTVTEIDVEGNHYLTAAQVVSASGLKTGVNLFKTKTGPAKNKLLQDPYVKLVEIRKHMRGKIIINVEERTDYAAVPYGEEYVIIDKEGFVLRTTQDEPALPLLMGMTVNEKTPGEALGTEETYLLTDTLELLSVVDENDIYFKKINFSTVVVKAYIYDDLYCEGTPNNIKNNMANISLLVQELYGKNITKGVIKVGKNNYLSYSPTFD